MELNIRLRSVNEYGGFLYSLEMLKTLRLFKGQRLINYTVEKFDTSGWVDFGAGLSTLQFEDFYLYMLREQAGPPFVESYIQEMYVSSQEMDLASQKQQEYGSFEEIDGKSYGWKNTYAIDKSVDDIILELDTLALVDKAIKRIDNVILKLGDRCFMPCFGSHLYFYYRKKEVLHPTLEEYQKEEHDSYYSSLKEHLKSEGLTEEAIIARIERERNRWKFVSLEEFLSNHAIGQKDEDALP